ncbi:MAG: hypothetical protein ABI604_09700 [Nitrospirota bacterium]
MIPATIRKMVKVIGKMGGLARAKKLTKAQRSAIGAAGGKARGKPQQKQKRGRA